MKKAITVLMIVVILIANTIPISAADTLIGGDKEKRVIVSGEKVLSDQQNREYFLNLSDKDQQAIHDKERFALQFEKGILTRWGSLVSVPNSFTMYQQLESVFCVPATIRSILMYINGTAPSQYDIAFDVGTSYDGTDPTVIAPYLNDMQSASYYVYQPKSGFGQNTMCSRLYSTIAYHDVPASIGVNTSSTSWFYTVTGHSLAVIGIYEDYSGIKIGDPAGGLVPGCPAFYIKDASTVYQACTRIVW